MNNEKYENNIRRLEIYPCIKCGSLEVNMFLCNHVDFNVGGGRCETCGTTGTEEIKIKNIEESYLIKIWNRKNNIKSIIEYDLNLINKLQIEVNNLQKFC